MIEDNSTLAVEIVAFSLGSTFFYQRSFSSLWADVDEVKTAEGVLTALQYIVNHNYYGRRYMHVHVEGVYTNSRSVHAIDFRGLRKLKEV